MNKWSNFINFMTSEICTSTGNRSDHNFYNLSILSDPIFIILSIPINILYVQARVIWLDFRPLWKIKSWVLIRKWQIFRLRYFYSQNAIFGINFWHFLTSHFVKENKVKPHFEHFIETRFWRIFNNFSLFLWTNGRFL